MSGAWACDAACTPMNVHTPKYFSLYRSAGTNSKLLDLPQRIYQRNRRQALIYFSFCSLN